MKRAPRVAAVQDISGFGRCSMTVALPVLSAMGAQCCPLPTAFLSTHTGGFEGFTFLDMTDEMPKVADHWASLGLTFQAIYSGFLGSARQIGIVEDFIRRFRRPDTVVVIDPVMGDYGRVYQTYTAAMCDGMARLAELADVITPNLTEAALLLGQPYDALPADIQQLVQSETGHPAFITIDQEGGMVSRLGADAVVTPGKRAVAATGDPVGARIAAQITARQLHGLGVNLNLAPVLDVNSNARNPVIGVRSFGDDPTRVADFAREAVLGYQNENVCCCGKHFPGHGDTAVDSHIGLPCVDKNLPALEACELLSLYFARYCTRYPVRIIRRILCQKV